MNALHRFLTSCTAFGLTAGVPALAWSTGPEPKPAAAGDAAEPAGASEPSEGKRLHLVLESHNLPPEVVAAIEAELARKLPEAAAEHGFTIASTPAADVIIQMEVVYPNVTDDSVTVIQSIGFRGGEVLTRGEAQSCVHCQPEETVRRGLALLPDLSAALDVALAEEAEREALAAAVDTSEPVDVPEPAPEPPPRARMGAVGYVGIAAAALGVGGAIGGGVLLAQGETSEAGNLTFVDYRPAGWATLSAGLATMVVGGVLIAVDLGPLARRRRDRAAAASAALVPGYADGPMLMLVGRF